jgi:hypothetical protein
MSKPKVERSETPGRASIITKGALKGETKPVFNRRGSF